MTEWSIITLAISLCVVSITAVWVANWRMVRIAEIEAKYLGSRVDEQPKGEAESNPA